MPAAELAAKRSRQIHLPWRIVFAVYALAMMIGLHWPRLQLGVGDIPAPDKIIHFIAFAGLTFLLWTTGWLPRVFLLWIVMMLVTFLSEVTQSIPILGRTFSWWDIAAGWLGVTSVVAWLWALGPVGGRINRLRLRMNWFIVQELFTRPGTWLLSGISGAIIAAVIGACAWSLVYWRDPLESRLALTAAMSGALAGGLAGAIGMIDTLVRRSRHAITEGRPCFDCGSSCKGAQVDQNGWGACPRCGGRFHLGQWLLRTDLPRWPVIKQVWRAGSLAVSMGLFAIAIYIALLLAHRHLPGIINATMHGRTVTDDFRLTVDAFLLAVILAIAARGFRKRIARIIDRQGELCRVCGYIVSATPVERGLGRCGECGTPFLRL